jgi:outer membrane lipoprotein SlyB
MADLQVSRGGGRGAAKKTVAGQIEGGVEMSAIRTKSLRSQFDELELIDQRSLLPNDS